ncbi:phage baseplate assembly protein V [Paraburkholderia sp. RL17-383-BIF-A]|uniref:phage baseplate assembly protein V n=1 Tax=Paraburkholderia sp. RL17-383-BIF-A TaxID=3031631 RepID=UPI0038BBD95F
MSDLLHGPVNRLARFARAAIGWARITFTNDGGNVQFVQVQVNDLETIDDLPRVAEFGLTSVAPDGSDVVMVNLGGGRNNAVVVATGHQESRPKGLKAGETMIYSQDGKSVYFTAGGGILIDAKGQDVVVNNAKDYTINCTGKFKVVAPGGVLFDAPTNESTGDMRDNIETNPNTAAESRVIFNEHDHAVTGIQFGGDTRISNPPTPTE